MTGCDPDCNGVCKAGPGHICNYYYIDKVAEVIRQWKREAGVDTPVLWKFDRKRNKVCLYSTKPGFLIGLHGGLYNKYLPKLIEADKEKFQNGIDIIECEEGV